jgi:hypothetical protein
MIEIQENVVPTIMLEEENTNEDVEPHAQINGNDNLNFLYNSLPHPSFQMDGWGFFCQFFYCNTLVNYDLKPHVPSPCEKMGGALFFGESLKVIPQAFVGDFFIKN